MARTAPSTPGPLEGWRILVVEDEYALAEELRQELQQAGATIVGPAPSVAGAMTLIAREEPVHGAVLDVNLQGETVFAVADRLLGSGARIVFVTGYDAWTLPARFAGHDCLEKPADLAALIESLTR